MQSHLAAVAVAIGTLPACGPSPTLVNGHYCYPEDLEIPVESVELAAAPRPVSPRSPKSVAVVVTPPDYPFVEVALLEARQQDSSCTDSAGVVEALRSAGAARGCDLLVIYDGNDVTYSHVHGGPHNLWLSHETLSGYRASCGVYYGSKKRSSSNEPAAYAPTR